MEGQVAPGTGHDFSHTGATRPTYQTNIINGLAAARFGGSNALHLVDASALTAGHVFIVFWIDNDPPLASAESGLWRFSGAGQGTTEHVPFTDGVIYDACGSTVRKTTVNPATAMTSPVLYEVITTSSEWTNLLNGTQLFTTGTNTVEFAADMQLGVWGATFLKGYVAGLYIFSAKKTGADRTDLIDYINDRFAQAFS